MLYLIEPHADDVFLSLHQHISDWRKQGVPITIITVYGNSRRNAEAAAYTQAVGAKHIALGCVESGSMQNGPGRIKPVKTWPIQITADDQIIGPLGLQHPEHIAVAQLNVATSWYLDTPGFSKLRVSGELNQLVRGMEVVSIKPIHGSKWRYIKHFKSQSKYFYFNPPESFPKLEIIVK